MVSAGGGAVMVCPATAIVLWLYLRRVGEWSSRFKAAGDDSYGGHFYDAQTQVNAGSSSLSRSN